MAIRLWILLQNTMSADGIPPVTAMWLHTGKRCCLFPSKLRWGTEVMLRLWIACAEAERSITRIRDMQKKRFFTNLTSLHSLKYDSEVYFWTG